MTSRRRSDVLALALLVLVVSLPSIRTFATGPSLSFGGPSDLIHADLPSVDYYARQVRAEHELPLWKTTIFYGCSSGMDSQERLFYPPMLVYAAFGLPAGHHLFLLFHALVLAIGMFALLRGERCGPLAAFAGAAMVALSTKRFGYELAGWESVLGPVAYCPAMIALHRRSAATGARGPTLLLALTVALSVLAGNAMVPIFLALVLPLASVVALGRRVSRPALRRLAKTVVLGSGVGFALAAPVLLSAYELARTSHRAQFPGSYGFPFGLGAMETLRALVVADVSRRSGSWDASNGMGLAALPFACAALAGRRHGRALPAFLIASFLALSADTTTLCGSLVSHLPVIGQFSFRTRLLWIPAIGLAWLAASGIDALVRRRPGRPIGRLAAGLVAGAVLTGVAYRIAGLAFLVFLPVVFAVRWRRAAAVLVVALTVLELLALSERLLVRVPFANIDAPSPVNEALAKEPLSRFAVVTMSPWKDPVVPGYPATLDRIGGYNPLLSEASARFLGAIELSTVSAESVGNVRLLAAYSSGSLAHRPWFELVAAARPDLLALGATHVATRFPVSDLALVTSEARIVHASDSSVNVAPTYLYRVRNALPRAYLMPRAQAVPGEEQLGVMLGSAPFDGRRRLLVDAQVPRALEGLSDEPLPVEVVEHRANRVVLRANAPAAGGYVVLLDAFSPEWTATVDGIAAPIERANHLFRAVQVEGGPHVIEMRVHLSAAFLQGCVVAALAAFLAAGWCLSSRR